MYAVHPHCSETADESCSHLQSVLHIKVYDDRGGAVQMIIRQPSETEQHTQH